jgi:hypothetical protein
MPAPGAPTYSATAKVDAHTSFRDLIDSGSGAGTIKIRTSADALLATITLTDPCGTVNGTTGQLTLTAASTPNASATGTAAYAEVCNSTGTVHLSLDAQAGSSPVAGKLVINSLSIVSGTPVELVSATIG